jgi:Kdo2-lipid IVA lauroyltransferase/acyltransferase
MSFLAELILYYIVKTFGAFVRLLPVSWALGLGRLMGRCAYYFDVKHKSIVQANLKIAFADTKSPREIRKISKDLFKNYGQNLIELFRLPLMTQKKFSQYVTIEGKEHVDAAVKKGKGVILLAMHFGSWEMASLTSAMMGYPYRMIVKPQKRFSRLDALLNSYRECSGSDVIEKGSGTREFIKGDRKSVV